jgi:protein-S-isoprenylcysteine O-methyltransferase Ste14
MSEDVKAPNTVPWPPIIYLGAIALGVVLHLVMPLPWLGSPASDILLAVGVVMIVGVVIIDVAAIRTLRKARTTFMPHRASEHLVVDGPFSFSRNPIYLANTMLTVGIGLVAGILWLLPLALIAAFVTQKLAIAPEERHLAIRFGKRYRDYQKKVRRWI